MKNKTNFTVSLIVVLLCGCFELFPAERLQPPDLEYLGAFRLPDGVPGSDVQSWAWGGFAMTYYPDGDSTGPDDGYPGSIFGAGHAWEHQVSEITIPVPVISATKNLNELNTASTLQSFRDIFDVSSLEMPRAGLAYLPKQDQQTTGKLYFGKGQHMHEEGLFLTHGWCELDLSNPQVQGTWYLNVPHYEYNTNDLLFDIPTTWAAANTPADILATGRYRDGGWSGQGPSLFIIGPWNQGNPPASGTSLPYTTLLRYTSTEDSESWNEATNHKMDNYHDSDEWSGASWLSAGNKAAVVFVGTKGTGDCWYGNSEGPCLACDNRGWWSTGFDGQFIFYDPDDLAGVAAGSKESWEPQPYATLNVDQYLYHIESTQQWYHLGAACFDRANGLFYVFEPYADDDKPIVHVWRVTGGGSSTAEGVISLDRSRLNFGAVVSGAVPGSQTFSIENSGTGTMNWTVSDNATWLSVTPSSGTDAGMVTVSVAHSGLAAGSYSAAVTVASSDAANTPQTVTVALNVYGSGSSGGPFGNYSTPENGAVVSSSVPFTGWALDDVGVESVKIYRRDGGSMIYIGDAVFVEGARPDVEQAYPDYPMNYRAGWGYMMLTNFLPGGGNGTFTIYAVAEDKEGNQVTLGSKTITCDNAHAVKPFGAIDTPLQGGTASGTSYRNQGWLLTPLPNTIPTDGSTISVLVDGQNLGNPTYNIYRSDIAGFFPGYSNSGGAAAYFDFDTTAYDNGVHTIAWSATDNAGNTDGIGSRYFTIQNSGNREHSSTLLPFYPSTLPSHSTINIETRELERVVVPLGKGYRGHSLPIGSSFNGEEGVFYWQPGPGFVGTYDFEFTGENGGKRLIQKIKITIVPKFKVTDNENKK
ncbi:MAG: BACON domain-containing protein [bacterium]|nr:BACON domain-containing protein [bacterium]